jgi:hypothetical protein
MRVDRAIQIFTDEPKVGIDMFNMAPADAMVQLEAMKASGNIYLRTEGCPTFDYKKGCQCEDMTATANMIKKQERF